MGNSVQTGPAPKVPPRWRRELRTLHRVGPRKWWSGLKQLRRFHRSVDKMRRKEGGGHDH
jgi:hypothetical protein